MSRLTDSFRNIFKIEELKDRILFTIFCLMAVRLGAHITLPGVDFHALDKATSSSNSLFGLYDLFVGGAFKNAAIFGLGIMPYISSSIIIQLLGAVVPYFQKLQKEGEDGRKKITQLTRLGTVLVSIGQASGMAVYLSKQSGVVAAGINPFFFTITTVICLTAGCMLMMWIGEQITERGIGNGISLIIFIGIVARFPNAILTEVQMVATNQHNIIVELVLWAFFIAIVTFVVLMTQGIRKIPVQYAKRVIGRKVYGGVTQHIPMRINTAGVMPIIFAQSILFIPTTVAQFFPNTSFGDFLNNFFSYRSMGYSIVFAIMIVFFTYFYTAIAFNPRDVADTMKKQGGFIPGVRPGKHTSDYIDNILTHITLPGAIFLAIVAILPAFVSYLGVTSDFAQFFGGTSLLIMVGVALDTLQQVESHLTMRNYEGLMKAGKIKGRVGVGGY
ncbi:MAG: preprotein translocase subunit SecY [Bacteroidota bacterium]|nr:preprotein translocase subunit SecY [Bacteroidota bacterium]MDP4234753.1 preprotein translocase subunit SecY [Bacteroidota bacterium]MDP4242645.1 preprotein translocase subunit SecY [Bacteroidota bacterium]MDP4286793.1 preprotein translocase subunit SecY [Bacteroidota bacterium]